MFKKLYDIDDLRKFREITGKPSVQGSRPQQVLSTSVIRGSKNLRICYRAINW